jgi:hypothetical protein
MERLPRMQCQWCGSNEIRESKFRLSDVYQVLLLKYPVRCRSCDGRGFDNLFAVLKLRAESKARRKERRRNPSASA